MPGFVENIPDTTKENIFFAIPIFQAQITHIYLKQMFGQRLRSSRKYQRSFEIILHYFFLTNQGLAISKYCHTFDPTT